jgi:hypothetical protein
VVEGTAGNTGEKVSLVILALLIRDSGLSC